MYLNVYLHTHTNPKNIYIDQRSSLTINFNRTFTDTNLKFNKN